MVFYKTTLKVFSPVSQYGRLSYKYPVTRWAMGSHFAVASRRPPCNILHIGLEKELIERCMLGRCGKGWEVASHPSQYSITSSYATKYITMLFAGCENVINASRIVQPIHCCAASKRYLDHNQSSTLHQRARRCKATRNPLVPMRWISFRKVVQHRPMRSAIKAVCHARYPHEKSRRYKRDAAYGQDSMLASTSMGTNVDGVVQRNTSFHRTNREYFTATNQNSLVRWQIRRVLTIRQCFATSKCNDALITFSQHSHPTNALPSPSFLMTCSHRLTRCRVSRCEHVIHATTTQPIQNTFLKDTHVTNALTFQKQTFRAFLTRGLLLEIQKYFPLKVSSDGKSTHVGNRTVSTPRFKPPTLAVRMRSNSLTSQVARYEAPCVMRSGPYASAMCGPDEMDELQIRCAATEPTNHVSTSSHPAVYEATSALYIKQLLDDWMETVPHHVTLGSLSRSHPRTRCYSRRRQVGSPRVAMLRTLQRITSEATSPSRQLYRVGSDQRNQVDARWFPIVQRQPTSLNQGLKIDISLNKILFEKPLYSENECIENRTSYMVPVFLPLYFTYQNIQLTNPVFTQLADIPFMTKDGHFILNGTPRTIVQQLVRAPGIYYKIRLSKQNKRFYLISFLTQNGNWLRIWNTKKLTLWGRINRLRRVPVYFLLQSLGFSEAIMARTLTDSTLISRAIIPLALMIPEVTRMGTQASSVGRYYSPRPKLDMEFQIQLKDHYYANPTGLFHNPQYPTELCRYVMWGWNWSPLPIWAPLDYKLLMKAYKLVKDIEWPVPFAKSSIAGLPPRTEFTMPNYTNPLTAPSPTPMWFAMATYLVMKPWESIDPTVLWKGTVPKMGNLYYSRKQGLQKSNHISKFSRHFFQRWHQLRRQDGTARQRFFLDWHQKPKLKLRGNIVIEAGCFFFETFFRTNLNFHKTSGSATGYFKDRRYSFGLTSMTIKKKLNQFQSKTQSSAFQPQYLLFAVEKWTQLYVGKVQTDDIDHLKNRHVRLVNEILHAETRRGLLFLKYKLKLQVAAKQQYMGYFQSFKIISPVDPTLMRTSLYGRELRVGSCVMGRCEATSWVPHERMGKMRSNKLGSDAKQQPNSNQHKQHRKEHRNFATVAGWGTKLVPIKQLATCATHRRLNSNHLPKDLYYLDDISQRRKNYIIYRKYRRGRKKWEVEQKQASYEFGEVMMRKTKDATTMLVGSPSCNDVLHSANTDYTNEIRQRFKFQLGPNVPFHLKNPFYSKSSLKKILDPDFITLGLGQFFALHPLSQMLDQINTLSEGAHQRRLTSLGIGGVNRDAGLKVRDVHPSHYGKICVIETPEGKNAGLVHALTLFSRINALGNIKSPRYRCPTARVAMLRTRCVGSPSQLTSVGSHVVATQVGFHRCAATEDALHKLRWGTNASRKQHRKEHRNRCTMGDPKQVTEYPSATKEQITEYPSAVSRVGSAMGRMRSNPTLPRSENSDTDRPVEMDRPAYSKEQVTVTKYSTNAPEATNTDARRVALQRTQHRILTNHDMMQPTRRRFRHVNEFHLTSFFSAHTESFLTKEQASFFTNYHFIREGLDASKSRPKMRSNLLTATMRSCFASNPTDVDAKQRRVTEYPSATDVDVDVARWGSRWHDGNQRASSNPTGNVDSGWVGGYGVLPSPSRRLALGSSASEPPSDAMQLRRHSAGVLTEDGKQQDDATTLRSTQRQEQVAMRFASCENVINASRITQTSKPVSYQMLSPSQFLSLATSLIPFLEHNDGTRALMGGNMQRQAVPLCYNERPLVQTGYEINGNVAHVNQRSQILYLWNFGLTITRRKDSLHNDGFPFLLKSNQATCKTNNFYQSTPLLLKGTTLTDNSSTNQGDLALGKNILLSYMPWEGYNFEDAVILSDRLVQENTFTSYHLQRYEVAVPKFKNRKRTNDPTFTRLEKRSRCVTKIGQNPIYPKFIMQHNIETKTFENVLAPMVGRFTRRKRDPQSAQQRKLNRHLKQKFLKSIATFFTNNLPGSNFEETNHLTQYGLVKPGTWLTKKTILLGIKQSYPMNQLDPRTKTFRFLVKLKLVQPPFYKDLSLVFKGKNPGRLLTLLMHFDRPYPPTENNTTGRRRDARYTMGEVVGSHRRTQLQRSHPGGLATRQRADGLATLQSIDVGNPTRRPNNMMKLKRLRGIVKTDDHDPWVRDSAERTDVELVGFPIWFPSDALVPHRNSRRLLGNVHRIARHYQSVHTNHSRCCGKKIFHCNSYVVGAEQRRQLRVASHHASPTIGGPNYEVPIMHRCHFHVSALTGRVGERQYSGSMTSNQHETNSKLKVKWGKMTLLDTGLAKHRSARNLIQVIRVALNRRLSPYQTTAFHQVDPKSKLVASELRVASHHASSNDYITQVASHPSHQLGSTMLVGCCFASSPSFPSSCSPRSTMLLRCNDYLNITNSERGLGTSWQRSWKRTQQSLVPTTLRSTDASLSRSTGWVDAKQLGTNDFRIDSRVGFPISSIATVSALNVGSHDAIEETFLTEEETFVILAALFQRNGADMMGSNDELLTLFNRRIKVRIIRKLLKKNNQLLGELKLAQTFASEIQQISQLLGIHGNLATKIRREDPLREFSTDDLTWLSDFQANNPDCPDNLRALVAQCRPSLKQTRQHDAREQQWTTKDMRLVPASQRASQQFTKYDVAFASTLPRTQKDTFFSKMTFFVIAKRAIRVGDKVAGRHGNKGVVSLILPQPLMPYIQDGTSIDLILNPLGVPSRMNVGQLFECLLGLASRFLNQIWQITAFDELHEYGQVVDLECVDAKDVGSHRVASHPGQLEDAVVDVDVVATHRRPTSHQLTHQTNELYGKFAGYADVMGNPPRRPHRPKSLTKYRVAKASSVLRNVASYKVGWGRCEATTNEHRWTNATRPSNQLPRHPKHYRRYERDEAPRLGSPSRRHVKVISKAFVYRQLYQAQLKAGYDWLIQPNQSCKQYVFDGRTGEVFPQQVTCGISYILKLNHLVEDKIHARSIGPYSMISQQPLQGKKRDGGQRLGEMEMWALGGYSAAFVLQECLTYKSDDKKHRADVWKLKIPRNFKRLQNKTHPEATHVLFSYFRALCLDGIHIKL